MNFLTLPRFRFVGIKILINAQRAQHRIARVARINTYIIKYVRSCYKTTTVFSINENTRL